MGWFTSAMEGLGGLLGLRETKARIEEKRYRDEQRYYELNRNRQINEDTQSTVVNLRAGLAGIRTVTAEPSSLENLARPNR